MFSIRRLAWRTIAPVLIGSAVLCGVLILLGAAPVAARPVPAPIDLSNAPAAGGLDIPPLPVGSGPPVIDGLCNDNQYGAAAQVTYTDASGVSGMIYLLHSATDLYVCVQGGPGTEKGRFFSVYLDPDNSRELLARPSDYGLKVMVSGSANTTWIGTGSGGYTSTAPANWLGVAALNPASGSDAAEYRIDLGLAGGACGQTFGLAVYHHWVNLGPGDDYGWPSNQYYDSPKTWTEVNAANQMCDSGKIAYVYRHDTVTAADFKALLEGAGYTVALIPQSSVTATDFSSYDLTIVADDTGDLDHWGFPSVDVTPIITAHKPIIGLGEGGYAFFGDAGSPIGWPHGWHGPVDRVLDTGRITDPYYKSPNDLSAWLPGPFAIYAAPVNEVAIYTLSLPSTVVPIAWEPLVPAPDHTSLVLDGCYHLWGFSGGPASMNRNGSDLFLNAVHYLRGFQCPVPQAPPDCVTVVKTAQPLPPGPVNPGSTITYTLSYTVSNDAGCPRKEARLVDTVPDHTLFVPGSAGGVTPNSEGTLIWPLGIVGPGSTGSKSFAVSVLDTACRQQTISNTAKVFYNGQTFASNTVTHQVDCPPVIPPNNDPPYAESEIQVYPYPLVTGAPTQFSVRVFNNDATSHTVTLTFQTSPNNFGIGIPFSTLPVPGNPRVVTIGPYGYAEVQINWTPDRSGHYCIAVKIESAGYAPIYTYRNLDVAEDLKPGVTDVLTFAVANPTANPATIQLVVDNTCPGWTAVVNPATIVNAVPGMIYTATLSVTPPNPATLGTACHIDVQGWIGGQLIGGIRKLDVPPVNLPHSDPPWLEQEISTVPTPPISGTLNHVYIELNNPWPTQRVVTVTFSEAVFGAGIPFTPFATQVFTLPPHSLQKYGVPWTPIASASMHRCLLVTLQQAGFRDQTSQRNVDLVRRLPNWNPGSVHIPFTIGNPFPYDTQVDLNGILIGLNNWMPKFVPDPPPDLPPGGMYHGELMLVPAVQQDAPLASEVSISGDVVRVDVSVELNDQPYSGFSVEFTPPLNVYLPLILK